VKATRYPYVGEGIDGCFRSAQIDREEAELLPAEDPRREELEESARRWSRQARELLHAELRAWANGWLPQMAAVEFILGVYPDLMHRHPMVRQHTEDEGHGWYLDVYCDEETWAQRTGFMSGGERATWLLARSLATGELAEQFSRLDAERRRAFRSALEVWDRG
jgi:hypothetical protein